MAESESAAAQFDVAILGAGPVGSALALALAPGKLSVALVERPREPASTAATATTTGAVRAIALSYASRLILERFGAWDCLNKTPIEQIHVSQSGGFGCTRISREDLGLPALGYVTVYDEIAPRLAGRMREGRVQRMQALVPPRARLLVHAEGTPGEQAIETDYGRTAIVATVESDRPAHGVAWERFTPEGPLALLPLGRDYAVVWSRSAAAAAILMQAPDELFLKQLQVAFGLRAGRFRAMGARAAAPLMLRYRALRAAPGEIHIGNAAQTLHPVAGQGLNLGLRDAWDLAGLLNTTPCDLLGSANLAERFARLRRPDARTTIRATDLLARLYVRRDPFSAALRGAAFAAFDLFPPARNLLARSMIYGTPGCRLA